MEKPKTFQRDLAKLPKALAALTARPQWAVWRWTQLPNGKWQKPPFMAVQPDRHASTNDPSTWADYATALATVQAGQADGISYILTVDDPFAAIDLDGCCDPVFGTSVDVWAQNYLQYAVSTYQELTPSGTGVRIWGLADGDCLNRKFSLEIDGKPIAAELFRRCNKALTITGWALDPAIRELTRIDDVLDWAVIWGERRKAAAEAAKPRINGGNGFDAGGCGYTIDEIEQIVREGVKDGGNRSDTFHTIIGHYTGCDWGAGEIWQHLDQHPHGIGSRYLTENRLDLEVSRSYRKWTKLPSLSSSELAKWTQEWKNELEAKAPPLQPEPADPELDDDDLDADLEDEELDGDDPDERPAADPSLPPLHMHGDADQQPNPRWLIKGLLPEVGHGLLSGQWGTYKTFVLFDLAAALGTGQPFLGYKVKRQCGTLLIAAEGASQVPVRLDAVAREKCGNAQLPFVWYSIAPTTLLHRDAVATLVKAARQADDKLQAEFGLPLGLIEVDTVAACAGFRRAGDENDNAIGQAIMNVLAAVGQELGCFVLGVDHFGKDVQAGTRGAISKESSGEVVLAALGEKQLNGSVTNPRLAVRKLRGGEQGLEYPYTTRKVELGQDEDGDPITSLVIDWQPAGAARTAPPPSDPWAQCRRQDQRTAVLRLKRVLMAELAEHGVDLPIPPDGPTVRMITQEIVRQRFYVQTPADGTPKQKADFRRQRFFRALGWTEDQELIGTGEIGGVDYVWLARLPEDDEPGREEGA